MTWWTVRSSVAWRGEIGDGERVMREPNGERERCDVRRERKVNKIIQNIFGIDVRTISYLRWYCSGVQNFLDLE